MKQEEKTGTAANLRPAEQTEGESVKEKMIDLLKKLTKAERSIPDDERTLPRGFAVEDFKLYDPQQYTIRFNKTDQSGEYWAMWMKSRKCRKDSYIAILLSQNHIKVQSEAHFRKNYEYSPVKKEAA